MTGLYFFDIISPLVAHLLEFIIRVDSIEDGEFWTRHESVMTHLSKSDIPAHEELMVEDHTPDPFIVRPSSQSRKRGDRTDVGKQEDQAAT